MDRRQAFICDPASGPRALTLEEFGDSFTGVALAFEPTEAFQRTRKPEGLLKGLRERVANARAAVALILLLSAAAIVPGIVLPVFSKLFVDGIVIRHQEQWVAPLFLALGGVALLNAALTMLRQSVMLRLSNKLTIVGASRFMWHILHLPMGFFMQRQAGEIATRIDASARVSQVISSDFADAVIDVGSAAAFAAILLGYDLPTGAAAVALSLPNILLGRHLRERRRQVARKQGADFGKLGGATVGIIANIESLKASGLEVGAFGQWAGYHAKTMEAAREAGRIGLAAGVAPGLLGGLAEVAVLGIGAWRMITGALTVGDLVAIQALVGSFSRPLGRVFALSDTTSAVEADLNRVNDAFRNPADALVSFGAAEPSPAGEPGAAPLRGAVRIAALSYGYNPLAPPLLDGVDLAILPGQRVALVGRSGCGKSTLGRLICGLLAPSGGEISVDGLPLPTLSQRRRAENIAYVDQDIFLFEGTVRDNLTLWRRDIPDEVLTRALDDACLLEEVVSRPGELDAAVEEGGRNFSGGQRQRLEIARALVGDPCVLVLDEATAALDPETEKRIDENLRRRGCTCVIIAHRLSTVKDCSEIVVMRSGRVIERGTHGALLAADGEYAELARAA